MKNKETISALNALVEINNNRIEGYKKAAKCIEEQDVISILFQLTETCKRCRTELVSEILQLGGIPSEGIKIPSRFFRTLVLVRSILKKNLQRTTLNSCSYGERVAMNAYQKILDERPHYITCNLIVLLDSQYKLIKGNYSDIKKLQLKF